MIRTPDVAVTVTDGLLWLLNSTDGTPVLSYEVNRNKVLGIRAVRTTRRLLVCRVASPHRFVCSGAAAAVPLFRTRRPWKAHTWGLAFG